MVSIINIIICLRLLIGTSAISYEPSPTYTFRYHSCPHTWVGSAAPGHTLIIMLLSIILIYILWSDIVLFPTSTHSATTDVYILWWSLQKIQLGIVRSFWSAATIERCHLVSTPSPTPIIDIARPTSALLHVDHFN